MLSVSFTCCLIDPAEDAGAVLNEGPETLLDRLRLPSHQSTHEKAQRASVSVPRVLPSSVPVAVMMS